MPLYKWSLEIKSAAPLSIVLIRIIQHDMHLNKYQAHALKLNEIITNQA